MKEQQFFGSDGAINLKLDDKFQTAGLATRIAQTIAKRSIGEILVVGLLGAWGGRKDLSSSSGGGTVEHG